MKTRIFLTLIIFVFARAAASAQEETWSYAPQNTITFDIGAPIASLIAMEWLNLFYSPIYLISSAVQYERQLMIENWSVAGRLTYAGFFLPEAGSQLSSISAEGHCRYYLGGGNFFLSGMLGYANFSMSIAESAISRAHHFILGGIVGRKIDFGRPGGLVFEYAFGYYGAIGKTDLNFDTGLEESDPDTDEKFDLLAKFFIEGPRFNIHIGYRF